MVRTKQPNPAEEAPRDTTRVTKKRPEWAVTAPEFGPGAEPHAPTARGRRTERALLDAGRVVIARDGYAAAKIADIASLAGAAMGSFYTYFGGKEHLLVALAVDFKHDVGRRFASIEVKNRVLPELMRDLVACYWDAYVANGQVARMDLAWSRDQAGKIYVQDKMRANAAELWAWLQGGAYFFVCGDAKRMAKDVDLALHEIIAAQGAMTPAQAADYVKQLKKDKRYQRDVY